MKQRTDNYARCNATGQIIFFSDATAPTFTHPQFWEFYRVPAGQDPETFRGQLVGVNPGAVATEV